MHKLIEYVCDELDELEKKADKGNMSMSEIEYADKLAHLKKNLLKGEELYDDYSGDYRHDGGMVYARGRNVRRDSMGRYSRRGYSRDDGYSRTGDDMAHKLRELMEDAPDETTRHEIKRLVDKMERM